MASTLGMAMMLQAHWSCEAILVKWINGLDLPKLTTLIAEYVRSENGYGWLVGPESTKKILDIDSKEVLIGSSKDLGIKENDLIEDYISTLNNINLTGTINSERLKEELFLRRKM